MSEQTDNTIALATFGGGCFWCMQPPFDSLEGVISTTPGYSGGNTDTPTYSEVCQGSTGHAEVIQVQYDPEQISYRELLDVFWKNIDPTTLNRQFYDQGTQYRTAIFYHSEEQRQQAEESKQKLEQSGIFDSPIVTEISPIQVFYPAEEYHCDYYKKNPVRYHAYHEGSGRQHFIERTWGKNEKGQ